MNKLVFMGKLLSEKGIGPTTERVAVMDAREPESASEVQSFLGLVGYSSQYAIICIYHRTTEEADKERYAVQVWLGAKAGMPNLKAEASVSRKYRHTNMELMNM